MLAIEGQHGQSENYVTVSLNYCKRFGDGMPRLYVCVDKCDYITLHHATNSR